MLDFCVVELHFYGLKLANLFHVQSIHLPHIHDAWTQFQFPQLTLCIINTRICFSNDRQLLNGKLHLVWWTLCNHFNFLIIVMYTLIQEKSEKTFLLLFASLVADVFTAWQRLRTKTRFMWNLFSTWNMNKYLNFDTLFREQKTIQWDDDEKLQSG